MFKKILSIWTRQSLMKQALDHMDNMFKLTHTLFVDVSEHFLNDKTLTYDIYKRDQEINQHDIKVRRNVLEHLTINPREDVLSALIMTGVIVHIERIGDYSKNIFELVDLHGAPFRTSEAHNEATAFYNRVHGMFHDAQVAFFQGEPEPGKRVMDEHNLLKKDCDAFIKQVTESDTVGSRDAVVSVLATRYFKRVSAHLFNIASAVVNPFDLIGHGGPTGDD